MNKLYATATREGKWWMIRIPEIEGLTQARRLSDADEAAREYVAVTLDVPLEDVQVDVKVAWIGDLDVDRAMHEITEARTSALKLEREASECAVALAKHLAAKDVPLRDIGAIMGVSHQRAGQLVSA
ncbi:hypothetical protein QE418_003365 [Microbacterium testaceum]|uniref:hypothetical protein n=1 Tax=Microbacterium TaxID=33882 RepID=UPI00278A473D|nr:MULTISPECIES: hypothetical protein [Microbacterium]MDQ1113917.1 hypothetical protein [Microbacterium testaceum]MDR6098976.1 hypothetical protein [Microbacterium sp. SORGH_AS_0454]